MISSPLLSLTLCQFQILPKLSRSMFVLEQWVKHWVSVLYSWAHLRNLFTLPTAQPGWSRVTIVNEALSHSLFYKQCLLLFTQTSLSANPVLMPLSSFSLVWDLLRDPPQWIGAVLSNKPAWITHRTTGAQNPQVCMENHTGQKFKKTPQSKTNRGPSLTNTTELLPGI